MKKVKVGCDLDGLIICIDVPWLAAYNAHYDDDLKPEQLLDWDIAQFTKPECGAKIYEFLVPELYDTAEPYLNALDFIKQLQSMPTIEQVVFVTSSPGNSFGRKYQWLKDHGIEVTPKTYIEMVDKSYFIADYLIDDYQENLRHFLGDGILFNRPWNEKFRIEDSVMGPFDPWDRFTSYADILTYFTHLEEYVG